MSGTPVCSVVIPTYNGARTIGEQLAALAAQSFTEPFEVLAVYSFADDLVDRIPTGEKATEHVGFIEAGHGA